MAQQVTPRVRPRKALDSTTKEDPVTQVTTDPEEVAEAHAKAAEDPIASGKIEPETGQPEHEEIPTESQPTNGSAGAEAKSKLQIMDLTEVEAYFKSLWYGQPGVGKTVLAGSVVEVPDMCPVLFVDAEGGTMSVQNKKGIRYVRVRSYADILELIKLLRDPEAQKFYKTIVIDSLSEVERIVRMGVVAEAVKNDPSHDREIPYQQDWNRNSERNRRIVRILRDLPYNIIFTALSRDIRDDATGTSNTRIALPGQLADEVAGFIDVVGLLTTQVVRKDNKRVLIRRLAVQPTGRFVAKDRSNKLGPVVDQPTMLKIYNLIHGKSKPIEEEIEAETTEEQPTETKQPNEKAETPQEELVEA